ncbi:MAG: UDP-N-acetylglucosamine 2-epimerase (non-hydrolyzing) [Bacteroidia bacterium]|nr:UDP-N-acetylglucosamine 2-epimerase (non-hydrolyzing) [Bacteroidia bacterium]
MKKHKLLFVFGTRPEAIKLAPLIKVFLEDRESFETKICVTAQHRSMLDQVLEFFRLTPDYDLDLMKDNQSLGDITASCIRELGRVMDDFEPALVFVQGDTTTTFAGALTAYYKKSLIAHVEAGMRTGNKFSPFPEEGNRKLVSQLAEFHFAATKSAARNLSDENISDNVFVTGNTVIDALQLGLKLIEGKDESVYAKSFFGVDFSKKIILVTGHRRESFGEGFMNICNAIKKVSISRSDVHFVYPVHLNPNVAEPVNKILGGIKNVSLIEPLSYEKLIWLMNRCYFVLTDSGGIQEEAPSLGKPVLVMRKVSERMEGIEAGNALLLGTSEEKITGTINLLLDDETVYRKMSRSGNPYGDGTSSEKIFDIVCNYFQIKTRIKHYERKSDSENVIIKE